MSYVNFTYRNKIEGCLSNMSPHVVIWRGKSFSMGEAAFHYAKYTLIANDPSISERRKNELLAHAECFTTPNLPGPAYKTLGGKSKNGLMLTSAEIQIWANVCDQVQLEICSYKLSTYKDIQAVLRKTVGVTLIHSCRTADSKMNTEHWCGRMTDDGKIIGGNTLGKIWMMLRDSG